MRHIPMYMVEFLGTFFLVLIGTGAIIINNINQNSLGHLGVCIVFGTVILVMIYTCGHVSGAHFNPAVTISFSVWGGFEKELVIPYILSQIMGAICGSISLKCVFGNVYNLGATLPNFPVNNASVIISFAFEVIFTFCLMFVIMSVATNERAEGSFAGIAIGLTVLMCSAVAGPISGGSFNPARSIGPAIASGNYSHLWIYIIAPIIGSITAGGIYTYISKTLYRDEKQFVV